jgi:hypothetical protein
MPEAQAKLSTRQKLYVLYTFYITSAWYSASLGLPAEIILTNIIYFVLKIGISINGDTPTNSKITSKKWRPNGYYILNKM